MLIAPDVLSFPGSSSQCKDRRSWPRTAACLALLLGCLSACGGDPRDTFNGFWTGMYAGTLQAASASQSVNGTGLIVQISSATSHDEVIIQANFSGLSSSFDPMIAVVSGDTLTFPSQTFTRNNTNANITLTMTSGSGTYGKDSCGALASTSSCLKFDVNWTDSGSGAVAVTFTGTRD